MSPKIRNCPPYIYRFVGLSLRDRPPHRPAKATLLQHQQADLLRMAVMTLYPGFRDLGMRSRVVMVLHDAVYVEAPEEEAQAAGDLIKTKMGAPVQMPVVPLEVEME
jgi:DNA polymerase I-like protein with 3'-5' exonuclease and polymerase domains